MRMWDLHPMGVFTSNACFGSLFLDLAGTKFHLFGDSRNWTTGLKLKGDIGNISTL